MGRCHLIELDPEFARELLTSLLKAAVDGIITVDGRGIIEIFNPAAEMIFGHRMEEVLGKNVSILMGEPHRSRHDGYIEAYQKTKIPKIIGIGREEEGLRKDGTPFPVELAVSEMNVMGQTKYLGIVRDITERKRAERKIIDLGRKEVERTMREVITALACRFDAVMATIKDSLIILNRAGRIKAATAKANELLSLKPEDCGTGNVSNFLSFEEDKQWGSLVDSLRHEKDGKIQITT